MKTATQLKKELMRHIFSSSISFFYTKNEFLILLKHFKIKMQRLLVLKEKNNSLDPVTQINSGVCSVMYIWIVSVVLKKGTVIIISSDPSCMQRWQCSIYKGSLKPLIKNVEDTFVFLTQKVFISVSFSFIF